MSIPSNWARMDVSRSKHTEIPYPHPRSAEYILGLAAMRGSQWGVNYAEGFECVMRCY